MTRQPSSASRRWVVPSGIRKLRNILQATFATGLRPGRVLEMQRLVRMQAEPSPGETGANDVRFSGSLVAHIAQLAR